ncbi:ADP-heptose--LPS heptosyltransferase [Sneathiella sp. P13V-1]|uniref:glycosyltransferase family 9 protein n=1 Tax=Sneathiella sp. P13V-1 TaxID=2697366 RepID=UPI00187B6E88|nr:glycosyltransferase family 9 protein [Sneathiella sp. P13V-1]MBE7635483.1 ADP-heptose--LPS heptosyltransferase [Sneathiella sp. P13V-1]
MTAENILVIKHGALGDVVLAQSPFQAIRAHHPDAKITLLTTKLFKPFMEKSGLFDEVWVDEKPKFWQLARLWDLKRKLVSGKFNRVYDLQTSTRSSSYLGLIPTSQKVEWSGVAKGCTHPHNNPERGKLHTIERQAEQLNHAGIKYIPKADFTWAISASKDFNLPSPYSLLVPGGSAHRPEKRWPAVKYAELANLLTQKGIAPVLIGGKAEQDVLDEIMSLCPDCIDLSGKTGLEDLAGLGDKAVLSVGNDTGPLHLIAAVGCPTVVLFSNASDPARARPRGADVTVLREADLADLSFETVVKKLKFPDIS